MIDEEGVWKTLRGEQYLQPTKCWLRDLTYQKGPLDTYPNELLNASTASLLRPRMIHLAKGIGSIKLIAKPAIDSPIFSLEAK